MAALQTSQDQVVEESERSFTNFQISFERRKKETRAARTEAPCILTFQFGASVRIRISTCTYWLLQMLHAGKRPGAGTKALGFYSDFL